MNIIVAGDFCDRLRMKSFVAHSGSYQTCGQIKEKLSNANYSILNFEAPIVLQKTEPISKCGNNLSSSAASIEFIKKSGFNCATLANNHILDQGETCLLETVESFNYAGIDTVGAGRNLSAASQILYKEIEGRTIAIINCCEHEFSIASSSSAGACPINAITQYYAIKEAKEKANYVLIIVHGGVEHFRYPSPRMKELYRFFIDVGADAVINHHQHCTSGYEIFKQKPIFYGIGNFLFDHVSNRNNEWNKGFMVSLYFKDDGIEYDLIPYIQCSENVGIEFMNEDQKNIFQLELDKINRIIQDDEQLFSEFEAFNKQNNAIYKIALSPYNNRLLKGLFKRGLLPSFMTRDKRNLLLDVLNCESHFERMISYLNKL